MRNLGLLAGATMFMLIGCASEPPASRIERVPFGQLQDGTAVDLYTLRNRNGMEARIITYGGIVTHLTAPDSNGRFADVVLGYDTLEAYLKDSPYFGSLVGRYANRIANGKFTLNDVEYRLAVNNGPNALHGGLKGFDKVVWAVEQAKVAPEGPQLALAYLSKDGEEGYPGNLTVKAVYTLTDDNGLRLEYTATTDRDTVVNLSQHSYFNLRGRGDVLDHVVQINADRFTPIDDTLIPTGEIRPVAGTPFDFRKATAIGARIGADDVQLKFGRGYDHNFVLADSAEGTPVSGSGKARRGSGRSGGAAALRIAATVYEPETGRVLEVLSTEPGLQFYSGNFFDGSITGKGGWVYQFRNGLCMEPQHFPDSPNQPDFPSTVLKPGEIYKNTIVYRFSAR